MDSEFCMIIAIKFFLFTDSYSFLKKVPHIWIRNIPIKYDF